MGEVNSVTVTVRPNASEVYWSTVVVNARQFGFGILLFVIVILFFAAGSLFHWLNPTEGAGWYHLLEKSGPVLGICSFPVLMIFVGAAVTTKRFFLELSNTLGVTYRFSDAGIDVEPSVGNPHLGWSNFQNAVETHLIWGQIQLGVSQELVFSLSPNHCDKSLRVLTGQIWQKFATRSGKNSPEPFSVLHGNQRPA